VRAIYESVPRPLARESVPRARCLREQAYGHSVYKSEGPAINPRACHARSLARACHVRAVYESKRTAALFTIA